MVMVEPDVEASTDQVFNAPGRPSLVWKAMFQGTLAQQAAKLLPLLCCEPRGGSSCHRGLKTPGALKSPFLTVHGVDANPEVIGDLLIPVRAARSSRVEHRKSGWTASQTSAKDIGAHL
jgi:hypothetical protein